MNSNNMTQESVSVKEEPPLSSSDEPASTSSAAPLTAPPLTPQQHPKWNDWRWQVRNRIRTFYDLTEFFPSL